MQYSIQGIIIDIRSGMKWNVGIQKRVLQNVEKSHEIGCQKEELDINGAIKEGGNKVNIRSQAAD